MQTLEHLRRKITSASDLGAVVSTMKTLAAVSIRQYETAVEALTDYDDTIDLGFQIVLREQWTRPEASRASGTTGAVVFGSDQGLCGQFNETIVSLVRAVQRQANADEPWMFVTVGGRAEDQLLDAGVTAEHTYEVPTSPSDITNLVQELLPQIERWRTKANLSRLLVFHNLRVTSSTFEPRRMQVLPLDPQRLRDWGQRPWRSRSLPTFKLDHRRLLSRLVRQYLFVSLFRACAESLASEHASRLAAMQAAEKNIDERLEQLRSDFNHVRQTAITEELLDVVSGFEALTTKSTRRNRVTRM